MDTTQRDILRQNRVDIVKDLEPRDVLDGLFEDGIFTENDCELINNGKNRKERCQTLLSLLQTRGPAAYGSFRNALSGSQYVHLQGILDSISQDSTSVKTINEEDTNTKHQSDECQSCSDVLPGKIQNRELSYALKKNCCLLYGNVEPNDILDHLYQAHLLSDDDFELIHVGKIRRERCVVLFQKLAESASTSTLPVLQSALQKKYGYISNSLQSKNGNIRTVAKEQVELQNTEGEDVERLDVNSLLKTVEYDTETNLKLPFDEGQALVVMGPYSDTDLKVPLETKQSEINFKRKSDPKSNISVQNLNEPLKDSLPSFSQSLLNKTTLVYSQNTTEPKSQIAVQSLNEPLTDCLPPFSNQSLLPDEALEHTLDKNVADRAPVQRASDQRRPQLLERMCKLSLSNMSESQKNHGLLKSTKNEGSHPSDTLSTMPNGSSARLQRFSSTDSEADHDELKQRPQRKRKIKQRTVQNDSESQLEIRNYVAPSSISVQPGVVKPYELPDKKLLTAFNCLSSLINQGRYDDFETLTTNIRYRYMNDADMMCILGYLQASRALFKTDFDEAKTHINEALAIAPKTKNPKYFTLELFTAKTRMYISQKKLEKLQNTLDDAKMLIESDKVGCTGRAAGWLYMNDARNITAQIAMLNIHNPNFAHTYTKLHKMAKESFHRALTNFQQDGGKDGPFGVGYAVCRLVILLMQCGDNGLTMDVLYPTEDDIKLAGGYLRQLEDSDIPIPKILDVHLLLAKCDYQYRRRNIVRALENSQAAYDLAMDIKMLEFTEHAHNRLTFLKTKTPFVIEEVDDFEEATKVLFQDDSSASS